MHLVKFCSYNFMLRRNTHLASLPDLNASQFETFTDKSQLTEDTEKILLKNADEIAHLP